jgi:predicted histidine transporter YuiF (NhaC family)
MTKYTWADTAKAVIKALIGALVIVLGLVINFIRIFVWKRDWKMKQNEELAAKLEQLHEEQVKKIEAENVQSNKIVCIYIVILFAYDFF